LSVAERAGTFKGIVRGFAMLFEPKERLNIWEWAERRRYVAKGVSAKTLEGPRLYSTADAPHQKKIQEAPTDPEVHTTVLIGASQVMGKTEMFNNVLGYHMDWEPRSSVVMYPQIDSAEKYSKKKFTPMVEASPCLAEILKPARTRDSGNTILVKDFRGGSVFFVGANSPASLRGTSGAVLLGDECDSNPPSCGAEGDPVELLFKRGESYPRCVKMLASTPTIKGQSIIWEWWESSDQQFWHVPCPKCGVHQVLSWKQVVWPKGEPEKCELICSACAAALNDRQRLDMYYAGEWRPTAPFKGVRGFHLNGIYVPWPCHKGYRDRLHEMAVDYLRAVKKGEQALQVWTNTFLCELWESSQEIIDHKPLLERQEAYTPEKLPEGIVVVMASIDVQKDRLECETVGLGEDDETWGIEYRKFFGDTEQDDVWQDLAAHLGKVYVREDGVQLRIISSAIDMRHKPHKVRAFVQRSGIARVFPVYGVNSAVPILVTTRFNKHYRLRTFAVNGKLAKDTIYARLKVGEPGPRFMHFPKGQGYNEEYFLMLTAEVLKSRKVRGVVIEAYEKVRERNEGLDIRVYYLAEIDILKPAITHIAKKLKAEVGNGQAPIANSQAPTGPREYQIRPGNSRSPMAESQPGKGLPEPAPGQKPGRKRISVGGGGGGGWSFK
jgi:phage terminase large subunit GpA-like protein